MGPLAGYLVQFILNYISRKVINCLIGHSKEEISRAEMFKLVQKEYQRLC